MPKYLSPASLFSIGLFFLAGYGLGMMLRLSEPRAMLVGVVGAAIGVYGRSGGKVFGRWQG